MVVEEIDLQCAIGEIENNGLVGSEPLLEEDRGGGGRGAAERGRGASSSSHQVRVHVLSVLKEQRRLGLERLRNSIPRK